MCVSQQGGDYSPHLTDEVSPALGERNKTEGIINCQCGMHPGNYGILSPNFKENRPRDFLKVTEEGSPNWNPSVVTAGLLASPISILSPKSIVSRPTDQDCCFQNPSCFSLTPCLSNFDLSKFIKPHHSFLSHR